MPAWGPPLIGAGGAIVALNAALAVQRCRARRLGSALRLVLELRRWDGLLPADLLEEDARP